MNETVLSELLYDFITKADYCWNAGSIIIEHFIVDEENLASLKRLLDLECDLAIFKDGRFENFRKINSGDVIKLTINPPRTQTCFFAENIEQILERHNSITHIPDNFIIVEEKFISWKKETHNSVAAQTYLILNKFVVNLLLFKILEEIHDETLILTFSNDSIQLIPKIGCAELINHSATILSETTNILAILDGEEHSEDKVRILKSTIHSYTKNVEKEYRFSHFLSHLTEIAKNYSNNYDLFISEFSFENEYENLLAQQSDFSKKLGEILSTIQTNILAVPLSLILAFTQMKSEPSDQPLIVNTSVTAAAIIFSTLLLRLLKSRKITLHLLENELIIKKKRFSTQLPKLYNELNSVFNQLDKQFNFTKSMISFLRVVTWTGLILTIIFYAMKTPQISELVLNFYHNIRTRTYFPINIIINPKF